jgi:peptidoglycan/LPS O-acetylase OafA/YrhL
MPDIMHSPSAEPSIGALALPLGETALDTGARWSARLSDKEDNAFDAIRFLLATLVVFEHSFFLISNRLDSEPIYLLTHGQTNSGALAVYMFFAISGFLVTRSYLLTANLPRYLAKRVARIVPGFLVATFVACVVFAPLVANNASSFFAAQNWPSLIVQALALRQVNVSDILSGNPVQLIHGTLWTIKYEFDCYIGVAILGSLGLLAPRRAWLAFGLIMFGLVAARIGWIHLPTFDHGIEALLISSPDQWPYLFPFFIAGSAFYVYRDYVPKFPLLCVAAILLIVASSMGGGLYWVLLFGATYLVVYLALSASVKMELFGRRVDLSYGVYLYGWPVGQLVLYFTGQRIGPYPLFFLTMAITLILAYASWRMVENPALRFVAARRRSRQLVSPAC